MAITALWPNFIRCVRCLRQKCFNFGFFVFRFRSKIRPIGQFIKSSGFFFHLVENSELAIHFCCLYFLILFQQTTEENEGAKHPTENLLIPVTWLQVSVRITKDQEIVFSTIIKNLIAFSLYCVHGWICGKRMNRINGIFFLLLWTIFFCGLWLKMWIKIVAVVDVLIYFSNGF